MIRYAKPRTLDAALALLADGEWRILAGGTDFYPALGDRPLRHDVLDINGLDELRGISDDDAFIRIGARTTWTDIMRSDLPPAFDALKQAAREVGSIQIQNAATVAGNLCNASPAADGVPALLVLDAEIELRSAAGTRSLPLAGFITGNRRTALIAGEMVTAIKIAKRFAAGRSAFEKLGARRYLVISIAMAAARVEVEAGRIVRAAVAVGACSVVAKRLTALENALIGTPLAELTKTMRAAPGFDVLSPIDDARGSAEYRREGAREIVTRALLATVGEADARIGTAA